MKQVTVRVLTAVLTASIFCGPSWAGMFGGAVDDGARANLNVAESQKASSTKARATTDVSDLWWNPSESGWGMQLVQNNNFVFATLFVYGSDGSPTWYTAPLNNSGGFTWTGPLYATTGPWFAAMPFDSNQVGVRQVGSMTFHAIDIANGTLTYTVDGSAVAKSVTRQTLVNESIGGIYNGVTLQNQVCVPALGGTGTFSRPTTLNISQIGNSVVGQSGGCTLTGTYSQSGKMGDVTGTYSCISGEIGSFNMFEIVVTETGILARLSEQSNFCSSISAQAGGVRQ